MQAVDERRGGGNFRLAEGGSAWRDWPLARRIGGAKKLVGEKTAWRILVSDYRVIYDVVDAQLTVTVVRAAHGREVYDP